MQIVPPQVPPAGSIAYTALAATPASDYLPGVAQSGAVSTFTTQVGHYIQFGKLVFFWGKAVINNAGAVVAGNPVVVNLPTGVAARVDQTNYVVGTASLYDLSATIMYKGHVVLFGASSVVFFPSTDASVDATNFHLGAKAFTAALATGDIIVFSGMYEAA